MPFPPGRARFLASAGTFSRGLLMRLRRGSRSWRARLRSRPGTRFGTQARPEANTTVDIIRYFGGLGSELKGETIPFGEHVLSYTRREPLGVVGAIIPWNAPVL